MKREGSAPLNPLDIDTIEQTQKYQEYGNAISITPKCAEDAKKAKAMEAMIAYYMSRNEGKMQKALQAALLDGFNLDPSKYLKPDKPSINIPVDDIRKELKWRQRA